MQESSVRHYHNVFLIPAHQPPPCVERPFLDDVSIRRPTPRFAVPSVLHQAQVDRSGCEFASEVLDTAARVAGLTACFLKLGQSYDAELLSGQDVAECIEGSVDGPSQRRGYHELDVCRVREAFAQLLTLLLPLIGQERVPEVLVRDGDVVVALSMPNTMNSWCHWWGVLLKRGSISVAAPLPKRFKWVRSQGRPVDCPGVSEV